MNIQKRALSLFLSLALVLSIFGVDTVGANAAQNGSPTPLYLDSGDILITDSGYFANGDGTRQDTPEGGYLITQHDSGAITKTVSVVGTGAVHGITIRNINIDVSNINDACAFSIAAGASVNLTLEGTNTLKSGMDRAGLEVPGNTSDSTQNALLTITEQSTGSLSAASPYGAGIGGGCGTGGSITINGGSVTAAGGFGSAGIGGGEGSHCGTVQINGGSVTAAGGFGGAGIGGGAGSGGSITINGGSVNATGGTSGSIITGGSTIPVNGGGAGIGGGINGSGGNIAITGGTVTAKGSYEGAGIGGGMNGAGGTIRISGGTVTAQGSYEGAGIGGGSNGAGGSIQISGGTVTATDNSFGAGIGGGLNGDGGSISISGGTVTATGNSFGAGIGGGDNGILSNQISGGNIDISGGTVTATGEDGAGIGGGDNCSGGSIQISGGTVKANSNGYGSGIGGGCNGGGGTVTVSGPDTEVTAKGHRDIGSYYPSNATPTTGGSLTVSGGATVAMRNSDSSLNTNASTYYKNCRIITGTSEKKYDDGGAAASVTLLTATLTAQPAAGGQTGSIQFTAKAMNGGTSAAGGTFSFAYCGAKDSGIVPDANNLSISADGTASCTWTPPTDGLTVITAKYKDSGNHFDALKAVYCYDPDAIDLSAVSSGGFGYTYGNHTVTISQNGRYVFTGSTKTDSASGKTANIIDVPAGITADVTLKDASIDVSATDYACAFSIASGAAVNLTLEGTNTLKSGSECAGLQVPGGAKITIFGTDGDRLTANGGNIGAGIGGGMNDSGGTILISGGIITANGGSSGAGIGGTNHPGGSITITGGSITANGGDQSAGIGGGYYGAGGTVTISGAGTQVYATGKNGGRDIGSGDGNNGSGTLTVGDGSTAEPLPQVELLSAGTNAANPNSSRPQFMNCVIRGAGAKGTGNNDISGCYDKDGKIRLTVIMTTPVSAKVGESVTLTANVKRCFINDTVTLPGKIQFFLNGVLLGSAVSAAADGTGQMSWTPKNGNTVTLKAAYVPTSSDCYASAESSSVSYTPGKITPTVSIPTASPVNSGDRLSASTLTGGKAADANGAAVSGLFTWANPNTVVTAFGNYEVIFTPDDTSDYNTVSIWVPVTVTASSSESNSSNTSAPSLPASVTDTPTNSTVDLSGATFPAWVTGVSLAVTPEAANGTPNVPGNTGGISDPQGAAVYHLVISQTGLNLIGSPFVYNIKLLDQNGNPITSFTGSVIAKVAIPSGIRGVPHIFRYEEGTKTFTDLGATVQNGYLVFTTTHFSYYVIAGTGNSITLDTKSCILPAGGRYQIGVKLTGSKAASVKAYSTNDKIAAVAKLKNGNYLVNGKETGTAYIMFDVYDGKNRLLTHASVRMDVKTGIRLRGDSTRQIGVF